MQYSLKNIDLNSEKDVKSVAGMHLELLSWGPMAGMGINFLEKFCYTKLIEDDLMQAAIAEVDGKPAGFIVYTKYSITFHRRALKKHFFLVSYIMLFSILQNPVLILRIIKAIRLILSRRGETKLGSDPSAEILAIGVFPEYRSVKFITENNIKISQDLFNKAISYFKSVHLDSMRLVVDLFNKPTLFFYHSLGGRAEQYARAGDPMIQFFFKF